MKAIRKPYAADDYIRVRDFLVEAYRRTGKPPGWLIDRWNFVRHFSQIIHGTFDTWPDTVGLWEDERGEIVAVVCSEGEKRGEAFFLVPEPQIPPGLAEEMFEHVEEYLMHQEGRSPQIVVDDEPAGGRVRDARLRCLKEAHNQRAPKGAL